MFPTAILSIRPAFPEDASDVARLAALDSAGVPTGPLLLGVVDGASRVAVSVDTGAAIADPFFPTADLVVLLRQRADHLREPGVPTRFRRMRGAVVARLRRTPRTSIT